MKRLRFGLCLSAGLAGVLASAVATATVGRASSSGTVVTMFSEPGDYVGGGSPGEYDAANATFSGTLSTSELLLGVNGGTTGTSFSFDIAPASGSTLGVGYYPGAQRTAFRSAGHPGIDIYGDGRGCNTDAGAFEVRDLATGGTTITRLDLLYEQHCEGGTPALFGEIRIGEPGTSRVIVSSGSITWPSRGVGAVGLQVPVYVRNSTAATVSIGKLGIGGSDPGDFSLPLDQCSSQQLAAGSSCLAYAGFHGTVHGPRTASLAIPVGGVVDTVQLDADVPAGTTSLVMLSDAGDYIGAGQSYKFTPANARFSFAGGTSGVEMDVSGTGGQSWTVDMFPASGHIIAPGTYPNATRYPFNGTGNGLSVYGDGRGCNTLTGSFTVKQAVYSAVNGSLEHFEATFVQHCEGATPALHGTLRWFNESDTAPPPDVTNLTATTSGGSVGLTWTNPTDTDYHYTVIRVQPAQPLSPMAFTGSAVYSGTGTSTSISGLAPAFHYTVTAFTVDSSGNVSSAETLAITGP